MKEIEKASLTFGMPGPQVLKDGVTVLSQQIHALVHGELCLLLWSPLDTHHLEALWGGKGD